MLAVNITESCPEIMFINLFEHRFGLIPIELTIYTIRTSKPRSIASDSLCLLFYRYSVMQSVETVFTDI